MHVKFIVKEGNACCWHRLYTPFNHMPFEEGDTVDMGVYGKTEDPNDCTIYMFNRDVAMSPAELSRLRTERGFKVVVDIDDYWELPFNHYLYSTNYTTKFVPRMLEFIKMADFVTTTNTQLRDKLIPLNPNVIVYPNTMLFDTPYTREEDLMRFSYIGGIAHLPDVSLLRSSFTKIGGMPDIRDKAIFNLSGFDPNTYSPTWNSMMNVFALTRNFRVYGSLYVTDYMHHYDNTDVSLIPLVANRFNECKSFLKIVEASTRHIPCIVSKTLPYTGLKDAPGIMWVERTSDWLHYIKLCIKNPDIVKDKGEMLHEYMKEHYSVLEWSKIRYKDLQSL